MGYGGPPGPPGTGYGQPTYATPGTGGTAPSGGQPGGNGIFGTGVSVDDIAKYAPLAISILGGYSSYKSAEKADQLRAQALAFAAGDYEKRAPLRDLAMQRATAAPAQRPDLSGTFAPSQANPYARLSNTAVSFQPPPPPPPVAGGRPLSLGGIPLDPRTGKVALHFPGSA